MSVLPSGGAPLDTIGVCDALGASLLDCEVCELPGELEEWRGVFMHWACVPKKWKKEWRRT